MSVATRIRNTRAARALSRGHNWVQLAKFLAVGASGYVVNLAVYSVLWSAVGLDYRIAATCAFIVALTNNFIWNRAWTFRSDRGHFGYQGVRFLVVSLLALAANLVALRALVEVGVGKILAQAIAIVLVTPINFVGNKLWSFRR